jgi:hypothetical protein
MQETCKRVVMSHALPCTLFKVTASQELQLTLPTLSSSLLCEQHMAAKFSRHAEKLYTTASLPSGTSLVLWTSLKTHPWTQQSSLRSESLRHYGSVEANKYALTLAALTTFYVPAYLTLSVIEASTLWCALAPIAPGHAQLGSSNFAHQTMPESCSQAVSSHC